MNPVEWSRLAVLCSSLVHQVSILLSLLAPRGNHPADESRLPAAARAAEAAQLLIEALSDHPELASSGKAVLRFQTALLSWHRAVLDGSPIERRFQIALMQQAAAVLTCSLHVESHALEECARLQPAHSQDLPPARPGLH